MKRLYFILAFIVAIASSAASQTSHDYYMDFNQSHEKLYFDYVDGVYVIKINEISSDFKIYSSEYEPGRPDQDKYIFGSAEGHGGLTPGVVKKLSHPGSNISIEGGGTLHNVILVFDPENMTLKIEGELPAVPILIGQISGHEWQPDYGIQGVLFIENAKGNTYYYEVNLTGEGEFSFVTKLGNNSSDWATVDSNIRYAPASSRVAAPEKVWMPSQTFNGGTSNAWYPENFTPGTYIVEFSFPSKSIAVIKGDIPTGVDDTIADEDAPAVDVYSLSGVMLRHSVCADEAVSGLPRGLYIVGGKKIAVR